MDQELVKSFKLFKKQVDKLRSNQDFFRNLSWSLEYKRGKGVVTKFISCPNGRSIKSVLIDLRPFLLEGEHINFYGICNLLYRNLSNRQLKRKVEKAREAWSILLERKRKGPVSGIRLRIEPKNILSEENLNIWLYGEYFHLKQDKIKVLEQMNLTPMKGLSFLLFLDLLQRLSTLVFYLEKQVIDNILNKD